MNLSDRSTWTNKQKTLMSNYIILPREMQILWGKFLLGEKMTLNALIGHLLSHTEIRYKNWENNFSPGLKINESAEKFCPRSAFTLFSPDKYVHSVSHVLCICLTCKDLGLPTSSSRKRMPARDIPIPKVKWFQYTVWSKKGKINNSTIVSQEAHSKVQKLVHANVPH